MLYPNERLLYFEKLQMQESVWEKKKLKHGTVIYNRYEMCIRGTYYIILWYWLLEGAEMYTNQETIHMAL